ncbi:RNA polymerase recycling motor HelD [Clostridium beijerinckii]|jgi:ATP-dependent DNA helicase, Rep family|uniref:ATP-dependent DNA helicase replicase n=1 Tax=Clostridium beijerinckii (strain ATCC 51743 / NCIMB 8052) TaxID=290402 RepID=A6LWZ5_CLOB8|nr:RNA polymerase recycling motor HelD [Clostridium beijerinckii]ABR34875.1 ATP-dependent DNA helicase replicase [Clostridium beijerinckii NCIMB 8052]AIU00725.1 ATP-dependent DNA helicase replicase [Clostridium beijerinckii ATCC 35702]NRT23760.1 DNA helicase-2/ATP-dependent DNA helicase PcrA [Clostridium beijerinckii]NRT68659.1 DNA helicase-2/ATP-dependent DNA helicase PcrA [Clostridium beijerinckii]NRT85183.1 DNA helicase-2/ATP-dependent DNA helicase PcrA [Clostridium beijerinckii]
MKNNDFEWKLEREWLQEVLKEAQKQLDEKRNFREKFKSDAIEVQRELWENVGSVSVNNGLEQIVDFMQSINTMKIQKRTHEFTIKLEQKYERVLLSPYFARMDFVEKGEERAEKCYIGISNLINENFDFLIYDWRAPISSMFYDYEIGQAEFKCPEGIVEGELTLKRQYKINNGKIEYMFDSNLKIDDEVLQDILSKSTDTKMKGIVTTIQREQNKVIRNEEYRNLIVQGPAGSGKTSVALHRIAYLLYKHRDKITPKNIVIFSPNDIFNEYISDVLPELGEDNMCQTTFKEYMHKALGAGLSKENYSEMMEYILASKKEADYQIRINNIKFKSSMEFIDILKRYVTFMEKEDTNFKNIKFRGNLIISSQDLEELFYKDYVKLPRKRRLQKIRERILFLLKPYEEQRIEEVANELKDSGSYLDKAEIIEHSTAMVKNELKEIYHEINRMTKFDLMGIYKKLFENLEFFLKDSNIEFNEKKISEIRRYTLEKIKVHRLNYEDQIALLYLKGAMGDLPKTSEIKYVIIDEAQDYSPLQYEIFYQLFNHANMTILGDLNQSINPFMNVGDYKNISHIFAEDNTCIINLTKSYRSTMEITKFSRRLLDKGLEAQCVERSGEEPLLLGFLNEEAIKEKLLEDIKIYKEKNYKSIGIITKTAKEANEVYNFLKDKTNVRSIIKDDDEYVSGILVIPAYLAKGLEFDVVIIYNAGDENYSCEEERLLLYTAFTRALHVLRVYYSGNITPLLK